MNAPLPPAAEAALARGHTIEAIKIVREVEGRSLKEAKARVDARQAFGTADLAPEAEAPGAAPAAPSTGDLPSAAQAALARGEIIEAIRIVRQTEGIGLKAAKARVDGQRRAASAGHAQGQGVGFAGPPERSGPGVLVIVLVVVLALAWYVIAT